MDTRMTALANLIRALVAKWRDDASYAKYDEPYDHGRNDGLTQCADELEATLSPAELGGGEPDAWLVESERAGKVSAELWEVAADDVIADVVKEYGDAYGATTKRPLYSTPRADEAVVDDAMVERLAKYIYQQEAWKAGFSLDESLRHQAYWARAIPEARKMLTAALSPPSPGAAK